MQLRPLLESSLVKLSLSEHITSPGGPRPEDTLRSRAFSLVPEGRVVSVLTIIQCAGLRDLRPPCLILDSAFLSVVVSTTSETPVRSSLWHQVCTPSIRSKKRL